MGRVTFTSKPGYGQGIGTAALWTIALAALAVSIVSGVRIVGTLSADGTSGPASVEERIIDDALAAIQLDPNNVQARWQLSLALSTIGDHRRAKTEAENAIAIDSQSVESFYALGVAFRGLGDLERAEKSFVKAGSLPGSFGEIYREIYYDLGEIRMEDGRYAEAVEAFRGALANGPEATYVVIALADAYLKAGDTERAIEEYLAVLSYDRDNVVAMQTLRDLGVSDAEIEAAKVVDAHPVQ